MTCTNPVSLTQFTERCFYLVLQRGLISSVKRLFTARSKSGSAHKKQSKKEQKIKAIYNSKLSGTVTMVTLSQATNLHKATDALDGEPSAQEHHQISVKT